MEEAVKSPGASQAFRGDKFLGTLGLEPVLDQRVPEGIVAFVFRRPVKRERAA